MKKEGSGEKSTTIIIEKKGGHIVLRNSDGIVVDWPHVGADTMILGMVYQTLRSRLELYESFSNEICLELSMKVKWIV